MFRLTQGLHRGIVDRAVWDEVQSRLGQNLQGERTPGQIKSPSLLAGVIVDGEGEPLVATHACKKKVRYRYYISRKLQHEPDAATTTGMRIPARELEAAVIERIAAALDDPLALLATAGIAPEPDEIGATIKYADKLANAVRNKEFMIVRRLLNHVRATPREVGIELSAPALAKALHLDMPDGAKTAVALVSAVRLTRTGRAVRLVHSNGKAAGAGTPDPGLIKLLLKAREWWSHIARGAIDISSLARQEGVNDSWMSRVIRLNLLAPAIVDAILAGTQPVTLTAGKLRSDGFPIEWERQWETLAG